MRLIRLASPFPECNFVESSTKKASLRVDAPAGTEEIGIDDVRVVISKPIIEGMSRIWIYLVVMGSKNRDTHSIYLRYSGI